MTEVGQLSFRPIILLKFRLLQVNLLLPAVIGKVRKRGFFLRPSLRGALRRLNPTIPRHNAAPSNRFPQPVIVRSAATSQSSHPSYFDKPLVRTRSLQRFAREVSSSARHCEKRSDVAIHLLLYILQVHFLFPIKDSA